MSSKLKCKISALNTKISLLIFVFCICSGFPCLADSAETSSFPENPFGGTRRKVVVLDPGHGGYDTGSRGNSGTLEKEVALSVCRLIAKNLESRYDIVFTRDGDYHVGLQDRTAVANNADADLFISIHTGGGFLYGRGNVSVFYYAPLYDSGIPDSYSKDSAPVYQDSPYGIWEKNQIRHIKKSRALAEIVKSRFNKNTEEGSRISGSRLLLFEGADMPAVLIETGYLTNPAEEIRLNDKAYLLRYSNIICDAINRYFLF